MMVEAETKLPEVKNEQYLTANAITMNIFQYSLSAFQESKIKSFSFTYSESMGIITTN